MNQGILQWSPCFPNSLTSFQSPTPSFPLKLKPFPLISATLNSLEQNQQQPEQQLVINSPAKERRKLKNERRQSKAYNWKEEVEMKLIKKPKKRYASWTEELNLDNLAQLGPRWWIIRVSRVSRVSSQFTADRLALALYNNHPHMDYKLYNPTIKEKRKLKNGSISVKPRQLYPGCLFLRCVLNKEIHDFIRDVDGIGGFIGSTVGNIKRQINKPRPVDEEDMEKIFQEAKQEQEKADLAFQEKHEQFLESLMPNPDSLNGVVEARLDTSTKIPIKKVLEPSRKGRKSKYPKIGSSVRVVSGSFAEFSGIVKKVDKKNEKELIADPEAETPEDLVVKQFMRQDLEKVINSLSEREGQVIRWRFGLEGGRIKTLQEIGDLFGVTRERIRQIESSALKKLQNEARTQHLEQYLFKQ